MQEINLDKLNIKKKNLKNLSDKVSSIERSLSTINNQLDWQVKSKYSISGGIGDALLDIGEIRSKFIGLINILDVTINGYNDAEKQLESKLRQISLVNEPAKKSWFDKVRDFVGDNLSGLLKILKNLFIFGPAFIIVSGIEEIASYLSKTEVKMKVDNSKAKMILNNGNQDIKGTLKKTKEYNEQVKMMQSRLRDLGYTIKVDGYFGEETYKIVNEFKNKYGLGNTGDVQGVVGSQTWKYLFPALDGKLGYNPDQYKEEVKAAQIRLKDIGYDVDINGYFDDKTLQAINEFKDKNKLGNTGEFKGILGPQTWGKLFEIKPIILTEVENTSIKNTTTYSDNKEPCANIKEFRARYGDLINEYAKKLKVDPNVLGAIVFTESGGGGFYKNGSLKIRFEDHIFTGKLGSGKFGEYFIHDSKNYSKEAYRTSIDGEWKQMHTPGKQEISEYGALEFAKTLDENSAYKAISMGFGQIMGFNYKVLGYKSPKEMFEDFSKGEKQQIVGMMNFIEKYNPKMLEALQKNDLKTFGVYYNNSTDYGSKVKSNIEVYKGAKVDEKNNKNSDSIKKDNDSIKKDNDNKSTKGILTNSKYDVNNKTAHIAVTPKYIYQSGERSKEAYNLLIDQFYVATNERYKPRNNNTYCNIFAWDVSIAMGIELPRFVEVSQLGNYEDATGKSLGRSLPKGYDVYNNPKNANATELNANRLATWLHAQGSNYGWKEVSAEEAQDRANNGFMTIGVIKKTGIGHVQVVRPTPDGSEYNEKKGVYLAQAGSNNFNGAYYMEKCRASEYSQYKYYTHD